MTNVLVTSLSMILAALSANTSVACPAAVLKFHDVTVNANGVVTRKVTFLKEGDAQNDDARPKYVSVIRDVLTLEKGDEVVLNAGLQFVDASAFIKLKLMSQDRDAQGIMSSTFDVSETMVSTFSGVQYRSEKFFIAKVLSNYVGKGVYSKGCGEVIKTKVPSPVIEEDGRY